jgi:hypothetical protein
MQGMKTVKMTDLKSVLYRVLTLLPKDSVSEDMLEEWAYQAYESLAPREVYEIHVEVLDVRNHIAELPQGLFNLELVLYNALDASLMSRTRAFDTVNTQTDCEVTTDLNTGCTSETTTTTIVETKHPMKLNKDLDYPVYSSVDGNITKTQMQQFSSPIRHNNWRPLQPTSNSMMKGYLVGLPQNVYMGCEHTFTVQGGCLMTTFSEGTLAIAYTGMPTSDEGEIQIPDYEYVANALESYLKKKYWEWRMNLREEGAMNMYRMYGQEYEVLSAKATAQLMMPTLMEYQRLRNINKFINEDSPFAVGTGASNKQEKLWFNNIYTGRLWL